MINTLHTIFLATLYMLGISMALFFVLFVIALCVHMFFTGLKPSEDDHQDTEQNE